ncbi:cupin domain-containing protein [Carnobacterium jeotgali]
MEYKDYGKRPYMVNIQDATAQNNNFRTAIWTGEKLQLTVMSIEPNDEAGLEVHEGIDQFIRIEEGQGICKMGSTKDNLDFERAITKGDAILIPMNMWHNIINTGGKSLKLYTIYSGQEHEEGAIHLSRKDAPKK